jgi:pimeloyl-ACP methyl ester carboxylesterase
VEGALVLVHSPLVGPATWQPVAAMLAARGRQTCVPDLTPALAAGPPYWAGQVEAITRAAAGQRAVLIGHSGAGPLLAAAGSHLDDVRAYLFVDAGLPAPGRSWLSTVPPDLADHLRAMADADRMLPPWPQWWGDDVMAELIADPAARRVFAAECPRLPMAMFEEVLPEVPHWPDAPAAYLRLTEAYDEPAEQARALGWPVTQLDSHHLAPFTDPSGVAGSLLGLLAMLES